MTTNNSQDIETLRHGAWRLSTPLRRAIPIGALVGFFSAGVGSRLVMKITALVDQSTKGVNTDATATVGEFTLGGTFSLLALGTLLGVVSGLVYLGVRRWLPGPPAWHGVAFGLLTLFTLGNIILDPSNADFQIFEPILLVAALFAALFLVNGLILARLADRLHPEPDYAPSRASRPVAGLLVVIGALGFVIMSLGIIDFVDKEGTCLSAIGEGNGCAVAAP